MFSVLEFRRCGVACTCVLAFLFTAASLTCTFVWFQVLLFRFQAPRAPRSRWQVSDWLSRSVLGDSTDRGVLQRGECVCVCILVHSGLFDLLSLLGRTVITRFVLFMCLYFLVDALGGVSSTSGASSTSGDGLCLYCQMLFSLPCFGMRAHFVM